MQEKNEKPKNFDLTIELRKRWGEESLFPVQVWLSSTVTHRICTALCELCYMLHAQYFALALILQAR